MSNIENCTITTVNVITNNFIPSKKCSMCKLMKPLIEYPKDKTHRDGLRSSCKTCRNPRQREEYNRNKETYFKYINKRYSSNEQYKNYVLLHSRINNALKGKDKSPKTLELLGTSLEYFKKFIEYQFTQDMSWENRGKYWSIDRVIPCSSFDLRIEDEQKKCFNYSNCQPLTIKENRLKSNTRNLELEMQHQIKINKFKAHHFFSPINDL